MKAFIFSFLVFFISINTVFAIGFKEFNVGDSKSYVLDVLNKKYNISEKEVGKGIFKFDSNTRLYIEFYQNKVYRINVSINMPLSEYSDFRKFLVSKYGQPHQVISDGIYDESPQFKWIISNVSVYVLWQRGMSSVEYQDEVVKQNLNNQYLNNKYNGF